MPFSLPSSRVSGRIEAIDRASAALLRLPRGHDVRRRFRRVLYRGSRVECPLCQRTFSRFMPGLQGRPNAVCPACGSEERHRALWLYLTERSDLADRQLSLLHLAPEYTVERRLRAMPNLDYLTADLEAPEAMVHFDVTDIPYDDGSFDAIICSHVLEHIPDDHAAMSELCRVLRPGGWAVFLVPLDLHSETTLEDPNVVTPEQQLETYYGYGHVRLYGLDFPDRLRAAGFDVDVDTFVREMPAERRERYALFPLEDIYVGRKSRDR